MENKDQVGVLLVFDAEPGNPEDLRMRATGGAAPREENTESR